MRRYLLKHLRKLWKLAVDETGKYVICKELERTIKQTEIARRSTTFDSQNIRN